MLVAARAESGRSKPNTNSGLSLSSASTVDRLEREATRLEGQAAANRASERGLNGAVAVLGAGALLGPPGVGKVLGGAAAVAAGLALNAGDNAKKAEDKARTLRDQAEREKKAAAEKAAAEKAANEKAAAEKAANQKTAKQSAGRTRDGSIMGEGRGSTYGGRASERNPGRSDMISRTC